MAKYTPTGWRMTIQGELTFRAMFSRVEAIVKKRVRKYNLASLDRDDLMQEGRLAAAYAVDTYKADRGNLDGYISRVVSNALAMVATEALAQARQPYKQVQNPDGTWRKSPINHVELEHDMAMDESMDIAIEARDLVQDRALKSMTLAQKLDQLRLSSDAKALLRVRLHTPPELWILARNINRGRMKLEVVSVCLYLGWIMLNNEPDRRRYQHAARELREQFQYVLGVDDLTFKPIKSVAIDEQQLQVGAKCRNMKELRA